MYKWYTSFIDKLPAWLGGTIVVLTLIAIISPMYVLVSLVESSRYESGYSSGIEDGYDAAYSDGYDEGYNYGYDDGYNNAYEEAYSDGYDEGQSDGYAEGWDSSYSLGYDEGYDSGLHDGYAIGYPDGLSGNLSHDYAPYVAISGDKHFHRYICFALRDGDAFEYFGIRSDALDLGYTPCAFCTP